MNRASYCLPRPFRLPFGGIRLGQLWLGWVPAATGNFLPAGILAGYLGLGAASYLGYGRRNARRTRPEPAPDA